MNLNSYFDFADNEYEYFKAAIEAGLFANSMGAQAQAICEKYLKHLIDTEFSPANQGQEYEKTAVMKTHSLNRLMNFVANNISENIISPETKAACRGVDGFYFSTRYPGNDSIELTRDDLDLCIDAVDKLRDDVVDYIQTTGHQHMV
ncbi:MAG: HEPN domain-containing protein [Pseudobutyrivibrio sp.]|nr:HEPN domain-containing protein [Pseudobutyrivibrio sp.]